MRHIVTIDDFDVLDLDRLFFRVLGYKQRTAASFPRKILATIFYEPSTRTRLSFESAMIRLGGSVIGSEQAGIFSSAIKGESLEDSIRVISGYANVIALRHPDAGSARRAADVSDVPLINAGDGDNEHPTQALLDLFTIWEAAKKGLIPSRGLVVSFRGDNRMSRTVHSLARMLDRYAARVGLGIESVRFDGTADCAKPGDAFLTSLSPGLVSDSASGGPHIVYLTRFQKERHSTEKEGELPTFTARDAELLPENSIVMHPLPRTSELHASVDTNPRARYFTQARNGTPVRMALLAELLAPD
ncbi:MAG: aspartate carbamoyltransferase [Candidatus Pacebacteria bacterium]|nr:aspartate carbamoyltransferase [Candidatus Paceibacterota bacterium]MBP9840195.1 aspartate carbamoyltransferase [Candidatus Paceibacterota bacterium]